jgi:hypothetical protein
LALDRFQCGHARADGGDPDAEAPSRLMCIGMPMAIASNFVSENGRNIQIYLSRTRHYEIFIRPQ